MRFKRSAVASTMLLFGAQLLYEVPALADDPPPRHQSRTETGVDTRTGSFSFEELDLAIGGEGLAGLNVVRSYNSTSDGNFSHYQAQGWTNSYNIYVSINQLPYHPDFPPPQVGWPPAYLPACALNIAGGPKSVGFYFQGTTAGCGVQIGSFVPMNPSGDKLEFTMDYRFRFTGADGTVINFQQWVMRADDITYPDGTKLNFSYVNGALRSVFSNRGWAALFESPTKSCVVNTALTYVTADSACPANAQTVTYTYANGTYNAGTKLLTSRTKGAETRQYLYANNDHVNCIKDPGQTNCRIQNTYDACPEDPQKFPIQLTVRLHDYVTSQTDGSGRSYNYSYSQDLCPWSEAYADVNPDYRPFQYTTMTMTQSGVPGATTVYTTATGSMASFTDPLGRVSSYVYQASGNAAGEEGELDGQTLPEGNAFLVLARDHRGNILSSATTAKPGSGLPNLTTSSAFPATCSNAKTCNKPSSVTDARGYTTDFTYDANHGGVLTETLPLNAAGVQAVKRYGYVQRAAWLMTSGGGYAASPNPVWLLGEMRTCRTTATVGNACAGGTSDEVVTAYDYGPNAGPNNLLLRGMTVTADGVTFRTCYGYDGDGRKISETSPNAQLGSCP